MATIWQVYTEYPASMGTETELGEGTWRRNSTKELGEELVEGTSRRNFENELGEGTCRMNGAMALDGEAWRRNL